MTRRHLYVVGLLLTLPLLSCSGEPGAFTKDEAIARQKECSESLGTPVEIANSIGMNLVLIPAGEFMMGNCWTKDQILSSHMLDAEDWEEDFNEMYPRHRVTISQPFYLGATEVTHGQWEAVMGTQPWSGQPDVEEGADYAATHVSWEDAQEFCRRLSTKEERAYRLPTEAEWEYACRAGTTGDYHFESGILSEYAWCNKAPVVPDESGNLPADLYYAGRVGQKKPNAFGLYDMHGNVYEWCQDYYDENYYAESLSENPTRPSSGSERVIRGGSWKHGPWACWSAARCPALPSDREDCLGFRVAAVLANKSSQ